MALARKAYAFHQDGWQYTENNIDGLLMKRHLAKKAMRGGKHHLKGPPARSREAVKIFQEKLEAFLQSKIKG